MLSSPARLLTVLLAAVAATGCDEKVEEEVCYVPETPYGEVQTQMPALPCLPRGDARLNVLNPGCTEDFEVTSGPAQKTNASNQTTCCYTRSYDKVRTCQVGRPLWVADGQRLSSLAAQSGWG